MSAAGHGKAEQMYRVELLHCASWKTGMYWWRSF